MHPKSGYSRYAFPGVITQNNGLSYLLLVVQFVYMGRATPIKEYEGCRSLAADIGHRIMQPKEQTIDETGGVDRWMALPRRKYGVVDR